MKPWIKTALSALLMGGCASLPALSQDISGTTLVGGATPVVGVCSTGQVLYDNAGILACEAGGGSGTVGSGNANALGVYPSTGTTIDGAANLYWGTLGPAGHTNANTLQNFGPVIQGDFTYTGSPPTGGLWIMGQFPYATYLNSAYNDGMVIDYTDNTTSFSVTANIGASSDLLTVTGTPLGTIVIGSTLSCTASCTNFPSGSVYVGAYAGGAGGAGGYTMFEAGVPVYASGNTTGATISVGGIGTGHFYLGASDQFAWYNLFGATPTQLMMLDPVGNLTPTANLIITGSGLPGNCPGTANGGMCLWGANSSGYISLPSTSPTLAFQFSGATVATMTSSALTLGVPIGAQQLLSFANPNNTDVTSFQSASTPTASVTYTLPPAGPTANGQALTSTTAGAMSWATTTGSGTVNSGAQYAVGYYGTAGTAISGSGGLFVNGYTTIFGASGSAGTIELWGSTYYSTIVGGTQTGDYQYSLPNSGANDTLVGAAASQALTNKTINCASNTCSGMVTTTSSPASGNLTYFTGVSTVSGTSGATLDSSGDLGALTLAMSGNISSAAWTTNGVRLKGVAATITDTSSSGTVAAAYTDVLGGNTIAASSAVTYTDYYTMYMNQPVAGTNVTFTRNWSLGLGGSLKVGGTVNVSVSSSGSSTVNASPSKYFYCLDPTSNAITLNLPASPETGDTYLVKDCTGQAATHNITVTPNSGNIDGSGTFVMSTAYQSVAVTYTGSQWSIN